MPLAIVLISLIGCAGSKESILPADGPTMKTLYERHFSDIGLRDSRSVRQELKSRPIEVNEADLAGYSRDAFNELDAHFPRLPNPTLVMHIYPHLVGEERLPVPGYATAFPMYRQVEYALPGEVPREAPHEAHGNETPSRMAR